MYPLGGSQDNSADKVFRTSADAVSRYEPVRSRVAFNAAATRVASSASVEAKIQTDHQLLPSAHELWHLFPCDSESNSLSQWFNTAGRAPDNRLSGLGMAQSTDLPLFPLRIAFHGCVCRG